MFYNVSSLIVSTEVQSLPSGSTVSLQSDCVYKGAISSAVTFTPSSITDSFHHSIKLFVSISGAPTVDWGTTHFINGETPDISESGDYIVYYDYFSQGNYWCCGAMKVS